MTERNRAGFALITTRIADNVKRTLISIQLVRVVSVASNQALDRFLHSDFRQHFLNQRYFMWHGAFRADGDWKTMKPQLGIRVDTTGQK